MVESANRSETTQVPFLTAGSTVLRRCSRRAAKCSSASVTPSHALHGPFDQELAHHLGARRAARFAGGDTRVPPRLDPLLEAGDLCRLAGPFSALQRDEKSFHTCRHESQPNM